VVRLSPTWTGRIRASQLGILELQTFRIEPERLPGLLSVADEKFFASAAQDHDFAARAFLPGEPFELAANHSLFQGGNDLRFRVRAVQFFIDSFEDRRPREAAREPEQAPFDARERLRTILRQTTISNLLHLNLNELVTRVRCTPRHFSRIFRELTGVSFRDKQNEARLNHALELLARTDSKVVDIAFESGFGSVSLFNLMFKRRFRMGPRDWRKKHYQRARSRSSGKALIKLAA
jgi:AraC-like DNA-binding protein